MQSYWRPENQATASARNRFRLVAGLGAAVASNANRSACSSKMDSAAIFDGSAVYYDCGCYYSSCTFDIILFIIFEIEKLFDDWPKY